jgi:hypothetical protein
MYFQKNRLFLPLFATVVCMSSLTPGGAEESLLSNGGFEEVNHVTPDTRDSYNIGAWTLGNQPELLPKNWFLHEAHPGTISMISEDVRFGQYACKIDQGWIYSGFRCSPDSVLKFSFWAKGSGRVKVMLFQYDKGADGSIAQFLPTAEIGSVELTDEWKHYTLELRPDHPDVNDAALAFAVAESMSIDDIVVALP